MSYAFPRLSPVTCFLALDPGYKFSSASRQSNISRACRGTKIFPIGALPDTFSTIVIGSVISLHLLEATSNKFTTLIESLVERTFRAILELKICHFEHANTDSTVQKRN